MQLQLQLHAGSRILRRMSGDASGVELREAIRRAGLRATASRIAVLRELRRAPKPVSHAEMVEMLATESWDRATLYRNLVDLANVGLARKVELGDRVWRFASAAASTHDATLHPHFVCVTCGDVECLPEVMIRANNRGTLPRAIAQREVEVQVRGVCDGCQT